MRGHKLAGRKFKKLNLLPAGKMRVTEMRGNGDARFPRKAVQRL